MSGSSITDRDELRARWAGLARDDAQFATFLRDPAYLPIVTVAAEQGAEQLEVFERDDPELLAELLPWLREQARVGSPELVAYGPLGELAPMLIRYARIVGDLERWCGSLTGRRVLEIGGGFGAQAATIMRHARVAEYTLVDLPEQLELARRYLGCFDLEGAVRFEEGFPSGVEHDLVVSNYAFSELRRSLQLRYLEVFALIPRGYLICNDIGAIFGQADVGFDETEMRERLPFVSHHAEIPETDPTNYVLTWRPTAV